MNIGHMQCYTTAVFIHSGRFKAHHTVYTGATHDPRDSEREACKTSCQLLRSITTCMRNKVSIPAEYAGGMTKPRVVALHASRRSRVRAQPHRASIASAVITCSSWSLAWCRDAMSRSSHVRPFIMHSGARSLAAQVTARIFELRST